MDAIKRVGQQLAAARRRGEPFEAAWGRALDGIEGSSNSDTEMTLDALAATCSAWRSAYDRTPTPRPVAALSALEVDSDLTTSKDEHEPAPASLDRRQTIAAERDVIGHGG